jgi:HD-GYP domain-containing protein (c-di-GMP phosphodiesterase class II)
MPTEYRKIDEEYKSVQIEKLISGTRLGFDVYVRDGGIIKPLFNKGMVFTNVAKEILSEKGISEVFIPGRDVSEFNFYFSKHKPPSDESTAAVFKKYSFYKEKHHPIDRTLIIPGTKINFSLFALNRFTFEIIIKASEDSPASVDEKVLNVAGDIVIKQQDIPLYHEYLNSLLTSTDIISKTEHTNVKAVAIKENSKIIIKDLLDNPRSGAKIKESNILVNNMIDCIMENKDAIYDLLSLRNYDYYTYTHSVNVAVLSVGLGIAIGLKRDNVEKLGMGAMLHDIGKSAVPHEILNKQGKLTDLEYRAIQSHVIEGEKILSDHKEIPGESLHPVLQHHEKLTGKGYPFKLTGGKIELFGRITAIADCYDALTTQRPYKPAFTPFYALSLVSKETGDYDSDLLKAFIKMLGKIK